MEKTNRFIILLVLCSFINTFFSYPQCIPDTENCIDVLEPGQICPDSLPHGYVNAPYEVTFTVIPPSELYVPQLKLTLQIIKITIDTVRNLPPGLNYEPNRDIFYADSFYCILVSGVPLETGTYDLGIQVTPYLFLYNNVVKGNPVVNDTSLSITIYPELGSELFKGNKPDVICSPNPFLNVTRIGLNANSKDVADLRIYNLTGGIVYKDQIYVWPGVNYFRFTGQDLKPGIYLYSVSIRAEVFTGRIVKVRE